MTTNWPGKLRTPEISTKGEGVLDMIEAADRDARGLTPSNVNLFCVGMKVGVWSGFPDGIYRGDGTVTEVKGHVVFLDNVPCGTKAGDLLILPAPSEFKGLDRSPEKFRQK